MLPVLFELLAAIVAPPVVSVLPFVTFSTPRPPEVCPTARLLAKLAVAPLATFSVPVLPRAAPKIVDDAMDQLEPVPVTVMVALVAPEL
ncbi:hypothetical protein BDSB_17790 [Burkholderia dolosa PC543]|nr:hypothetical protein BDSB_17790 [Burkholderia dolosa PC543]